MNKKIPFKLEVNGIIISEYVDTGVGFLFEINGQMIKTKELRIKCDLLFICENCGLKVKLKSIENRLRLNKPFYCSSCRNSGERNGMYGKKFTDDTKEKISRRMRGINNPFYGKKHTNITKHKQRLKKIGLYDGDKNPMYNKTFFDVWVEKYGIDIATQKMIDKAMKHSIAAKGEQNPMYNKSIIDIWNEKYGEEQAKILYNNWISNIKKSLRYLYNDNVELRNKISNSLKGRIFSDNHRLKLRQSSIKYIKKKLELMGGRMVPHFNIYACQLFDEISKIKNINIQHALNGGEYYISSLGYWVDGYDQENNVVYEYYEREHNHKINRDLRREEEIKNKLKCEFIIIYENKEKEFLKTII